MIWLLTPVLGVAFYYTLILVHCCAHDSLTGSRRVNRGIGEVLAGLNFFNFTDFQALHVLHHSHTNVPGKDPHFVRDGESWFHYVVTHYPRLVAFTYTPYYRSVFSKKEWAPYDLDSDLVRRHDRINKLILCSGRVPHFGWLRIGFSLVFAYFGLVMALCAGFGGWAGVEGYFACWIVPWMIGQVLVADFNWRGHVGLPERQVGETYEGRDTRSYYDGIWKLINWATFGFYVHREHHLDPKGACMFAKEDPDVRSGQEAQFSTPA